LATAFEAQTVDLGQFNRFAIQRVTAERSVLRRCPTIRTATKYPNNLNGNRSQRYKIF